MTLSKAARSCLINLCWPLLIGLFVFSRIDNASGDECATSATVAEVATGLYIRPGQPGMMYRDQNLANIGFIIGQECVAVIDGGGSYAEGRELYCAIRQITDLPVCHLIVSHHHADHVLGNLAFKEQGAHIIGHRNLQRAMAVNGEFFLAQMARYNGGETVAENLIVMPDQLVSPDSPLELDLGQRRLTLTAHPVSHTDNDLGVFDHQTGTLWLSDLLFVDHVPAIDASARGWLELMTTLSGQSAKQAIPGHGPPIAAWPQSARPLIRYLSTLRTEVRSLLQQGADLEQAQTSVGLSEREHWHQFERFHQRNVIKVYTELEWED